MDNSGISALVQQLSDADRAQIGLAVLEYTLTGATIKLPPVLSLAFELIKERLSQKASSRGGARPGAGAPAGNRNAQKQSKSIKNAFDCFPDKNFAETQQKPTLTKPKNTEKTATNIPLCSISENNNINKNNNINIPITRARENSEKQQPVVNLFSAPADAPQKQSKQSRFTPPTVEMVAEYCRERQNGIDPQRFVDHYTVRGWIPKGASRQMTDWRAAVRTWERTGYNKHSPPRLSDTRTPQNNNPFASLD